MEGKKSAITHKQHNSVLVVNRTKNKTRMKQHEWKFVQRIFAQHFAYFTVVWSNILHRDKLPNDIAFM